MRGEMSGCVAIATVSPQSADRAAAFTRVRQSDGKEPMSELSEAGVDVQPMWPDR
jgi:hypothetical protein